MAIRFKHGGVTFSVDEPEEAAKLIEELRARDTRARNRTPSSAPAEFETNLEWMRGRHPANVDHRPWHEQLYQDFVRRLGLPQRAALWTLCAGDRITDEQMRETVGVKSNQGLAGVLSGISKQATALGVTARDVFEVENFRYAGTRSNAYVLAANLRTFLHKRGKVEVDS